MKFSGQEFCQKCFKNKDIRAIEKKINPIPFLKNKYGNPFLLSINEYQKVKDEFGKKINGIIKGIIGKNYSEPAITRILLNKLGEMEPIVLQSFNENIEINFEAFLIETQNRIENLYGCDYMVVIKDQTRSKEDLNKINLIQSKLIKTGIVDELEIQKTKNKKKDEFKDLYNLKNPTRKDIGYMRKISQAYRMYYYVGQFRSFFQFYDRRESKDWGSCFANNIIDWRIKNGRVNGLKNNFYEWDEIKRNNQIFEWYLPFIDGILFDNKKLNDQKITKSINKYLDKANNDDLSFDILQITLQNRKKSPLM